jgi:hypothetical protein
MLLDNVNVKSLDCFEHGVIWACNNCSLLKLRVVVRLGKPGQRRTD